LTQSIQESSGEEAKSITEIDVTINSTLSGKLQTANFLKSPSPASTKYLMLPHFIYHGTLTAGRLFTKLIPLFFSFSHIRIKPHISSSAGAYNMPSNIYSAVNENVHILHVT
jgi:hypothetical protein